MLQLMTLLSGLDFYITNVRLVSTSKIAELQNQIEEKQDVLNHEIKTRAKLEKDLGFVQKSLEDQRLLVIDLRRKLAAEENKTRALQVQLKNKVEECDELHTKHSQLSLQARQVQAVADKQRVATSAMEERLRHSAHSMLRARLNMLFSHVPLFIFFLFLPHLKRALAQPAIITLQGRTEALQQALAKATIAAQGPTHEDEFQQTRNNLPTRRATSALTC
jgi:Fe2+ transport system protein B